MTTKKEALFYGAASEIITPFNSNGGVEYSLIAEQVNFLIENGITGLFANGLASEALMMPTDERLQSLKAAVEAAKGRVPIMGNVIYNSVSEAAAFVQRSEDVGVNAIIITPPVVYKYTEKALFDYFKGIADSTKLPVYLYNAPETGNKISPEIIKNLFDAAPNFWGYKDSTQDIIHQQTVISLIGKDRHFELMSGSDAQIVTTMMLGGLGILSLLSCVFPKIIVEVVEAAEAGDWDKAKEIQRKILHIRQALKIGPFMAAYKYAATLTGGALLGEVKHPLAGLSDSEKEKIVKILKEEEMI